MTRNYKIRPNKYNSRQFLDDDDGNSSMSSIEQAPPQDYNAGNLSESRFRKCVIEENRTDKLSTPLSLAIGLKKRRRIDDDSEDDNDKLSVRSESSDDTIELARLIREQGGNKGVGFNGVSSAVRLTSGTSESVAVTISASLNNRDVSTTTTRNGKAKLQSVSRRITLGTTPLKSDSPINRNKSALSDNDSVSTFELATNIRQSLAPAAGRSKDAEAKTFILSNNTRESKKSQDRCYDHKPKHQPKYNSDKKSPADNNSNIPGVKLSFDQTAVPGKSLTDEMMEGYDSDNSSVSTAELAHIIRQHTAGTKSCSEIKVMEACEARIIAPTDMSKKSMAGSSRHSTASIIGVSNEFYEDFNGFFDKEDNVSVDLRQKTSHKTAADDGSNSRYQGDNHSTQRVQKRGTVAAKHTKPMMECNEEDVSDADEDTYILPEQSSDEDHDENSHTSKTEVTSLKSSPEVQLVPKSKININELKRDMTDALQDNRVRCTLGSIANPIRCVNSNSNSLPTKVNPYTKSARQQNLDGISEQLGSLTPSAYSSRVECRIESNTRRQILSEQTQSLNTDSKPTTFTKVKTKNDYVSKMSDAQLTESAFFFNSEAENQHPECNEAAQLQFDDRHRSFFTPNLQPLVDDGTKTATFSDVLGISQQPCQVIVKNGLRTPKSSFIVGHFSEGRCHEAPIFDPLCTQRLMSDKVVHTQYLNPLSDTQWEDIENFSDDDEDFQRRRGSQLFNQEANAAAAVISDVMYVWKDNGHRDQHYQAVHCPQSFNNTIKSRVTSVAMNPVPDFSSEGISDDVQVACDGMLTDWQHNSESVDTDRMRWTQFDGYRRPTDNDANRSKAQSEMTTRLLFPNNQASVHSGFPKEYKNARYASRIKDADRSNQSVFDQRDKQDCNNEIQTARRLRDASRNPCFVRGIIVRKNHCPTSSLLPGTGQFHGLNVATYNGSKSGNVTTDRHLFSSDANGFARSCHPSSHSSLVNMGRNQAAAALSMNFGSRNDLIGGSGVGVGNVQLVQKNRNKRMTDVTARNRSNQGVTDAIFHETTTDIIAGPPMQKASRSANTRKNSRKGASKRFRAKGRGSGSANRRGSGRSNGRNSKYRKNRPGSSGTNTSSSWEGNEDDPNLQHVGGAEMSF